MHASDNEHSERRGKCLAYGLLVVAAMTFTFELGRQHGVSDAEHAAYELGDGQPVATMRLMDEVNRLRAADDPRANPM